MRRDAGGCVQVCALARTLHRRLSVSEPVVACKQHIRRCAPASIRLVDNPQFQFGMALKPEAGSFFHKIVDAAKKFYLIKMKGFEVDKMVLMTVMMEGSSAEVQRQSDNLISVCASHGGLNAGAEAGYRGYFLTYMIAYLRDFGMQARVFNFKN